VDLRIAENNEKPSNEADPGVETKRTTRSHAFHHGEEGRSDDDVAAPACDGVHHRPQSANFQGKKFRSHPRDRGDAGSKETNVEDDGDEEEDTRPVDIVSLHSQVMADRNPVESNGSDDKGQGLYNCQQIDLTYVLRVLPFREQ
jgi:hypothetical protein